MKKATAAARNVEIALHSFFEWIITMTAPSTIDPPLGNFLSGASPDVIRSPLQTIVNPLLEADADALVRAEYGSPFVTRTAQRNGYCHRPLDAGVGTIDVAVPKLRSGTYFPSWLLKRCKSAESALITVIADRYLADVSARRMDKLAQGPSASTGSRSRR